MTTATEKNQWTPRTKLGWWSVWLEAAFIVMFILNVAVNVLLFENIPGLEQTVRPVFMVFIMFMLLCGLIGGVFGVIALIRFHEQAIPVWVAVLVGLFVVLIILNEVQQAFTYYLEM